MVSENAFCPRGKQYDPSSSSSSSSRLACRSCAACGTQAAAECGRACVALSFVDMCLGLVRPALCTYSVGAKLPIQQSASHHNSAIGHKFWSSRILDMTNETTDSVFITVSRLISLFLSSKKGLRSRPKMVLNIRSGQ